MQSTSMALPPSTRFHKSPDQRLGPPSKQLDFASIHSAISYHRTSSVYSGSSSFKTPTSVSPLISNIQCLRNVKIKAAANSIPEGEEDAKSITLAQTLQLGGMFGLCITGSEGLSISSHNYGFSVWLWNCAHSSNVGIQSPCKTKDYPFSVAHTMGNLLTNISLGKVNVSFTHTIKAMEPFFTVVLSALFLGERPSLWVVSSLLPIVGGVALASFTEASFNWIGFYSAMASNLTNQSRNVFSKKFMVKKEETLDNINLFSIITIISFILLVPAAIFIEGIKFTPAYLQSAASQGLNIRELCVRSLLAGFCFHSYQQVSYMILQMVSPVTHAVGNCVKRVVVIVSSVIFFQIPISPVNSLGTAFALTGVFLYSRAKRMKTKPKAA